MKSMMKKLMIVTLFLSLFTVNTGFAAVNGETDVTESVFETSEDCIFDTHIGETEEDIYLGDAEGIPEGAISVMDYNAIPDDGIDDREAITNAIAAASQLYNVDGQVHTVYVPEGTYKISVRPNGRGIDLCGWDMDSSIEQHEFHSDHVKIVFADSAVLIADYSGVGADVERFSLFTLEFVNDVTIEGGIFDGNRAGTADKKNGGHCLDLSGATNITVKNCTIRNAWTDGIYMGASYSVWEGSGLGLGQKLFMGDNITIEKCTITNSRRNNISVINADNVTVKNCTISDANGESPMCGIDIEPNRNSVTYSDEYKCYLQGGTEQYIPCQNFTIEDTTISSYQGKTGDAYNYFCFNVIYDPNRPESITARHVRVNNCIFNGDCYIGNAEDVTINDTVITGSFGDFYNRSDYDPIHTFTVTFDLNGKPGTAPVSQNVADGKTAAIPVTDPAADGLEFTGWYIEKECINKYDFSAPVTDNITLYAGWKVSAEHEHMLDPLETLITTPPIKEIFEVGGVPVSVEINVAYPGAVNWTGDTITKGQLQALAKKENVTPCTVAVSGLEQALPRMKKGTDTSKLINIAYVIKDAKKVGKDKAYFTVKLSLNKSALKKARIKGNDKKALQLLVAKLNEKLGNDRHYFEIKPVDLADASNVTIKAKFKKNNIQMNEDNTIRGLSSVSIKVKVPGVSKAKTYKYKAGKANELFNISVIPGTKIAHISANNAESGFCGTKEYVIVKKK